MTTVTINPDKTISIDGKKTFPVRMTAICSPYSGQTRTYQENINLNNNALYTDLTGDLTFQNTVLRPLYLSNGLYFHKAAFQLKEPDAPGLLCYWQPDEPSVGVDNYPITKTMTEAEIKAKLLSIYTRAKAEDPNHPVVLNHWTSMMNWYPYADIMSWDTYGFATGKPWTTWSRGDSIYAFEMASWDGYFKGTELNTISKPVWTNIQALGKDDLSWGGLMLTAQEARCNTYAAITLDVKGLQFFGYMVLGDWSHASTITGLYNNLTETAIYNNLMGELRDLNDVLVSETLDYSWTYHPGKGFVKFSNVLTKLILRWNKPQTNFNYILKPGFLIVVNKDIRPITTTISVSNLTSSSITTIGRETTGSGRTGRTILVSSGKFTDSFDGLAVHIYKIDSNIPCPPSQCNFTITQ